MRQIVSVCKVNEKLKIERKITILSECQNAKIENPRSGSLTTADFWNFSREFFFSPKISTKSSKIVRIQKNWHFQNGKTLKFLKHIDFLNLGKFYYGKKAKNPKNFSKIFIFWRSVIFDSIFDFLIGFTRTNYLFVSGLVIMLM